MTCFYLTRILQRFVTVSFGEMPLFEVAQIRTNGRGLSNGARHAQALDFLCAGLFGVVSRGQAF
jgi:hypothetical protein